MNRIHKNLMIVKLVGITYPVVFDCRKTDSGVIDQAQKIFVDSNSLKAYCL